MIPLLLFYYRVYRCIHVAKRKQKKTKKKRTEEEDKSFIYLDISHNK